MQLKPMFFKSQLYMCADVYACVCVYISPSLFHWKGQAQRHLRTNKHM